MPTAPETTISMTGCLREIGGRLTDAAAVAKAAATASRTRVRASEMRGLFGSAAGRRYRVRLGRSRCLPRREQPSAEGAGVELARALARAPAF